MVVAALPELAAQDCAARLLPASTGVTSVVTHVVNARGRNRSDPSPFVRDVLDGYLLGSAKGVNITHPLLAGCPLAVTNRLGGEFAGSTCSSLPASQPAPIRCAHAAHSAQLRTRDFFTLTQKGERNGSSCPCEKPGR